MADGIGVVAGISGATDLTGVGGVALGGTGRGSDDDAVIMAQSCGSITLVGIATDGTPIGSVASGGTGGLYDKSFIVVCDGSVGSYRVGIGDGDEELMTINSS